jgi:diacylglycerol kinase (ATP)
VRAGIQRVLAVGGDGTLHELVNALAHTAVALGVLPCGTGNDFARSQGLMGPLPRLLQRLAHGQRESVDLGQVEDTYYLNVAGVGFDAEVARCINARARKPEGALPYLGEAIRLAFHYEPPLLEVRFDSSAPMPRERLLLVAVGNASAYGGGMRICPQARVNDGLLDVMLAGDIRRWAILTLLPRVFMGRHVGDPRIRMIRARAVSVTGPAGVVLHADGEIVGGLPAHFRVHPGALTLWRPSGARPHRAD